MSNTPIFKTFFRRLIFPVVTFTHFEKLFSRLAHNNKLILVYHGVVAEPNHSISAGPLELKQFEKHMAYFARNFSVVSLRKIFEMYRSDYKPKKKTIAITFDDGYENNYTRVFPLLKKYNFPATIFVITQCFEKPGSITWYDEFDLLKDKIDLRSLNLNVLQSSNLKTVGELRRAIKGLNIGERNLLFEELNKQTNKLQNNITYPEENWRLMNLEEVKMLSASELIEIGAHSHNHPNLGEISPAAARDEIVKSKQMIEIVLQKEAISFAFPDGSYNDNVKRIAIDAGFRNLLSLDYRRASDLSDKSILSRYCLSSTTTFESNMIQVNRAFNTYGF